MSAPCIMVLGTTSDAGKSWLVTALCRYLSNRGLRVAPFKAQNMSNNARVVAGVDGRYGEIGSAQYFQALAARTAPCLDMNPVLLKPESERSSQVVIRGEVDPELTAMPWRERCAHVWPAVQASLDRLRSRFDVVVIEGAGSPAEINLASSDIVNMRVAQHAQADCLLVCDIDRGGAFAHLYGTWALLRPEDQARIRGFVLNKFRGDPALLAPGPELLEARTQVPTLGVIPMIRSHRLPEEDGQSRPALEQSSGRRKRIVIVSYPRISNLDEFSRLSQLRNHELVWTRRPQGIEDADVLILPGSKHTRADLRWLREQGLDEAIERYANQGRPLLGICGGLQMLGEVLRGHESRLQSSTSQIAQPGLALLDLCTTYSGTKTVKPTTCVLRPQRDSVWGALGGLELSGYEIHVGDTTLSPGSKTRTLRENLAWQHHDGHILGMYLHGLFENDAVITAVFDETPTPLEETFERLADAVAQTRIPSVLRVDRP